MSAAAAAPKAPLRGVLVVGAADAAGLAARLHTIVERAAVGDVAPPRAPAQADLDAAARIAIDYASAAELAERGALALRALQAGTPGLWRALRARGVFRGSARPGKVAFLFPGQGSQYVNMLEDLRRADPLVEQVWAEAGHAPLAYRGPPWTELVSADPVDERDVTRAEAALGNTAVGQPAVLAADGALAALLAAYGIEPDWLAGHSLGEYAALAAAGALRGAAALEIAGAIPVAAALERVGADPRVRPRLPLSAFETGPTANVDPGAMAVVYAGGADLERALATAGGYVVVANANSPHQSVIGGERAAVERCLETVERAGIETVRLPVGHAFHTELVSAAIPALRQALVRSRLQPPQRAVMANVSGEPYPTGPRDLPRVLELIAPQFARPFNFVLSLQALWQEGVRIFVEAGPRKVVSGFVEDLFGARDEALIVSTCSPKVGEVASFNRALAALHSAGLGRGTGAPR